MIRLLNITLDHISLPIIVINKPYMTSLGQCLIEEHTATHIASSSISSASF